MVKEEQVDRTAMKWLDTPRTVSLNTLHSFGNFYVLGCILCFDVVHNKEV